MQKTTRSVAARLAGRFAVLCAAWGVAASVAAPASKVTQPKSQVPRLGLWEVTTSTDGKSDTDKICITEEDLGEWSLFKRFEPECQENCKIGNGLIDCHSSCKYGKTLVQGTAKGTYDATVYELTLQARSGGKPGKAATIKGRYLAPQCGNIK